MKYINCLELITLFLLNQEKNVQLVPYYWNSTSLFESKCIAVVDYFFNSSQKYQLFLFCPSYDDYFELISIILKHVKLERPNTWGSKAQRVDVSNSNQQTWFNHTKRWTANLRPVVLNLNRWSAKNFHGSMQILKFAA